MLMLSHNAPPKTRMMIGAAAAGLALTAALAGCTTLVEGELPATHLDAAGEVAASHGRCGACHQGGTRGNGMYSISDVWVMESLPASEFDAEVGLPEPVIPESLYPEPEPIAEEGAQ